MSRAGLIPADVLNAFLGAAVFTASFGVSLGLHPVVPLIGFLYSLMGRRLARFKAGIALGRGDGLLGNGLALAFDAGLGTATMALLIKPAMSLELTLAAIAWTSARHTLSKGTLRLAIEKRCCCGSERAQALGVTSTILLDFVQGALTGFVYAGSKPALAAQCALAALGAALLLARPVRKALRAPAASASRPAAAAA